MTGTTPARRQEGPLGASPRLAVGSLVVFAAYGALLAAFAHGAESVWGEWAAGSYGAAALVATWSWRRWPAVPLLVALAGAFAAPAAILPVNWGATSEVRVVERAATLWLRHGSPYIASSHLLSWRAYDPYLPGMSIFGLPHALGVPNPLGDPLVWLALVTFALLAAATRIAAPFAVAPGTDGRRQALQRALLLVACPILALPMALGVTDPPVIALMILGLAWTARPPGTRSAPGIARPGVTGGPATGPAGDGTLLDGTTAPGGNPLLAGVVIGVACALKATAWPAFPVIFALVAARDGKRAVARFTGGAAASFVLLVAVTAPALLTKPRGLWQNIVAYPLGLSHRQTPAASPLPGHVLAGTGQLGHLAAILLLVGAALAVGASLLLRPPSTVGQAAMRLIVGLVLMILLAPDARFGYFAYPLTILLWVAIAAAGPSRGLFRGARSPKGPVRTLHPVQRAHGVQPTR